MDWWSLGVLAYIFFMGKYPFNKGHGEINNDRSEADRMVMYQRILDANVDYPPSIPPAATDVIRDVWARLTYHLYHSID